MLKKIKNNKELVAIFFLALILRIIGIQHGFPFIFHPDEPAVIRSALGIRFDINPGHFDWPHLHFYLNYLIFMIFVKIRGGLQLLGLQGILSNIFPLLWRDPLIFYFLSRLFNAVLGALTIFPIYLTGVNLFNKKVGLLSALVIALVPFHVYSSHFALIDVPMAFWLSWGLYFSSRILLDNRLVNYILAGFFIGLSTSTKYNGAAGTFAIILAHVFRTFPSKDSEKTLSFESFKKLLISGVAIITGFILGTPFAIFDFDTFTRSDGPIGALWQLENVGKVGLWQQIIQFFYALSIDLSNDFGISFLILYLLTVFLWLFFLLKKTKRPEKYKIEKYKIWFLLIPSLIFFFYVSGFSKTRSHYYMIVYPFVSVAVGFMINFILENLSKFNKIDKSVRYLFVILVFIFPVFFTAQHLLLFVRKDTRVLLYDWMQANVKGSDYLLYDSGTLNEVMKKFTKNEQRKIYPLPNLTDRSGYIILTPDPNEESRALNSQHSLAKIIMPTLRRGPPIVIYEF